MMKKELLIAILAIIGLTNTYGQDFSFGIKAGMNLATFNATDTENDDEYSSITGFHIGGLAQYEFSNRWLALSGEILFSQQGTEREIIISQYNPSQGSIDSAPWRSTIKLNYINIPLLAKFYLYKGFNLHAGPQIGFLISSDVEDDDGASTVENYDNTLDLGAVLGTGYDFDFGLFFQARFVTGLTYVNDDVTFFNGNGLINQVFQFSTGYKF